MLVVREVKAGRVLEVVGNGDRRGMVIIHHPTVRSGRWTQNPAYVHA